MADAVLGADPRIDAVTVTLRKLRPPLAVDVSTVGVAITRETVTSSATDQPSVRAFLGLGSNLGDRRAHLRRAVDQLRAGSSVAGHRGLAGLRDRTGGRSRRPGSLSEPGGRSSRSRRTPTPTASSTSAIAWRQPKGGCARSDWGPRTLDADVLWIDGVALDDPDLTVPHPRWRERRFVLAPLGELAPDLADDDGRRRRFWRGQGGGYALSRTRIL